MESIFTVLMLITAVASKNIPKEPKPDFVPTKELLDSIFNSPVSPIETPLEITPKTEDSVPSEKDKNDSEKGTTVELNLMVRVGAESGTDGVSVQEDIKLNENANMTKEKLKKVLPKIKTRIVDRVALGTDACAAGMFRIGERCSEED